MKKFFTLLLLIVSTAASWASNTAKLTILHTNDLHGMMKPFNYIAINRYIGGDVGGLARRSTLINQIRESSVNPVFTIDCGDIFTRGPWHSKHMGVPEIEAMNMMKYDMMCVGNNEFKATNDAEYSQRQMLKLMRRSKFPWLAANLTVGDTEVPVEGVHPFITRDIGGLVVGFLGLTTPKSRDYGQTKGWTISDPYEAAAKWVPIARKECDILIAVTHLGAQMDQMLASKVAGIDAIIGGDSHTFIPKAITVKNPEGHDVPIVQAGEQGVVIGQLDLEFVNKDGWHLVRTNSQLIRITSAIKEDAKMNQLLDRFLDAPDKQQKVADNKTSQPALQY